jgi:hypothetical protein
VTAGYVVFDTDVASATIRGRLSSAAAARLAPLGELTTFVTLAELTKWARLRQLAPRRLQAMSRWLSHVVVIGYDQRVAVTWGEVQARAQARGRPRPANDAWIAACCLAHGLPLATFNIRDFADLAEHEGLDLLDLQG